MKRGFLASSSSSKTSSSKDSSKGPVRFSETDVPTSSLKRDDDRDELDVYIPGQVKLVD